MVKLTLSGLEFYFDNELIYYINFGNLDLSSFSIDLSKVELMDKETNNFQDYK